MGWVAITRSMAVSTWAWKVAPERGQSLPLPVPKPMRWQALSTGAGVGGAALVMGIGEGEAGAAGEPPPPQAPISTAMTMIAGAAEAASILRTHRLRATISTSLGGGPGGHASVGYRG